MNPETHFIPESHFTTLCERLFGELQNGEVLSAGTGGETSQFIRFNQAKVRQTGKAADHYVVLSLMHQQRQAQGGIPLQGELDADWPELHQLLQKLREEVQQLPEDPYLILPQNTGSSQERHSGRLLATDAVVPALLPAMQGLDLSGIWASGFLCQGSANSEGQTHWFETETFCLDYSVITPNEKMVKTTFAGTEWDQAAYEAQIQQSREQLKVMERPPKRLEPGNYRTCFAPAAVKEFLSLFSWGAIGEASIQQGASALGKMRNEGQVLSPLFQLSEDFRNGTVPRFNHHGEMAPEYLPLIVAGRLENTLISSRTAKEYDLPSNFATDYEGLRSPVILAGQLPEEQTLSALDTGLYLSNLHYLNWSDRMGGRITGMTRYACFWVEHGEIVAPIENMRFDDSLYRIFGDQLEAVTNKSHFLPEVDTYDGRQFGGSYCPSLLVKEFTLTL